MTGRDSARGRHRRVRVATVHRSVIAAVLAAVVMLVLMTTSSQAYFSDLVAGSSTASAGHPGLEIRDMTIGGHAAGSGITLEHGRPYELAFTVANSGTAPWRGDLTLFDYIAAESGEDIGERGVVLVWPGGTPQTEIAEAVAAGEHSGASVITPETADTGDMPGADPPTTGQAVPLPTLTLGAGEQQAYSFQVVLLSNRISAGEDGTTQVVDGYEVVSMPVHFGASAQATGTAGDYRTGWTGSGRQAVEAIASVRVNTPPTLTDAGANTTPFLGQVGDDPTTDEYLRGLVTATDAEDDPDGDGSALKGSITWNSDFDPDTPGPWSATYAVKDSTGADADPISLAGETWTFGGIANGRRHTLALDSLGRVWVWGHGSSGRLGLGDSGEATDDARVPTMLPAFDGGSDATRVVDIAAGFSSSYAVTADGRVWAWGHNAYGLGNGSTQSDHPVAFDLPEPAAQISSSHDTTGVVTTAGNVYAWGQNGYGQVGDGTTATRSTPVRVDVSGVAQLSMGYYSGGAVTTGGDLHTWGWDAYGLLGDGSDTHGDVGNAPTRINADGTTYGMVSIGQLHALAVTTEGVVHGWGHDGQSRLGGHGAEDAPASMGLESYGPATHVATGYDQSWVALADGRLVTAGHNDHGELFSGNTTTRGFDLASDDNARDVVMAAGNHANAFFLRSDGHVYAIGWNDDHELGDGTTTTSTAKAVRWGFDPPSVP